MDSEFKENLYVELRKNGFDDDFIESFDELINYNKFNMDNLIELIDGVFDE